jgi:hypothetical protein
VPSRSSSAAQLRDPGAGGVGGRVGQEAEGGHGRADPVEPGDLGAERGGEAGMRAAGGERAGLGGAGDVGEHEEGPAEHGRLGAEGQRLGHGDAGGARGLQQPELGGAAVAERQLRGRVEAQDQRRDAGMGAAVHREADQPVLLDGAAGERRRLGDVERLGLERGGQPAGEGGAAVGVHQTPQRQSPSPRSAKLCASTMRWTSDAPSTSRACRA